MERVYLEVPLLYSSSMRTYFAACMFSVNAMRHVRSLTARTSQLLQYNTIISASQYAKYYFSLRHAVRQHMQDSLQHVAHPGTLARGVSAFNCAHDSREQHSIPLGGSMRDADNFRSKYFIAINVPGAARLQEQSAKVLPQEGSQFSQEYATSL